MKRHLQLNSNNTIDTTTDYPHPCDGDRKGDRGPAGHTTSGENTTSSNTCVDITVSE